jgi:cysteine sulfinate desulfinase/cysteine desulfurase-like protein
MQIYLDHGATTPTRPEAIALMHEVMTSQWGNPSSLHAWGERSTMAIERARLMVANLINGEAENIIFTSGGTEADNGALFGVARQYAQPQHMIVSSVEHSAIGLARTNGMANYPFSRRSFWQDRSAIPARGITTQYGFGIDHLRPKRSGHYPGH